MKTSEVLNRAADLIEERGWDHGGGWVDEDGAPLCLEGAIGAVLGVGQNFDRVWECPAAAAVETYLGVDTLFIWNDNLIYDGGRCTSGKWLGGEDKETAEDLAKQRVIEVLRATALIEAAKEQPVHEDADERAEVGAK